MHYGPWVGLYACVCLRGEIWSKWDSEHTHTHTVHIDGPLLHPQNQRCLRCRFCMKQINNIPSPINVPWVTLYAYVCIKEKICKKWDTEHEHTSHPWTITSLPRVNVFYMQILSKPNLLTPLLPLILPKTPQNLFLLFCWFGDKHRNEVQSVDENTPCSDSRI